MRVTKLLPVAAALLLATFLPGVGSAQNQNGNPGQATSHYEQGDALAGERSRRSFYGPIKRPITQSISEHFKDALKQGNYEVFHRSPSSYLTSFLKPCCLNASNKTSATQLERFSERD